MTDSPTHYSAPRFSGLLFGLVTFLSAYLLFQVQPLISKSILPWFGGTPSVWTTCMLFFQLLLFCGYAYAHLISARLSPSKQFLVHLILLIAAIVVLPILPSPEWKPTGAENPIARIVLMLAASVGLPFFVLSSTGPLVQNWFARAMPGRSPYWLYSLSNLGSLLGLLLYPFCVEILLDLPGQSWMWSAGFVVFALGCAACGRLARVNTAVAAVDGDPTEEELPPRWRERFLWFALAMVPSIMLLATTNQVCLDVASIPFLWVLPLTLYLLTFILSFAGEWWYWRKTCGVLLPVALVGVVGVMIADAGASLELQLLAYFSGLFFTAMCCHGELVRLTPAPKYLTGFYLWMSAGGAAGGLFVGVVAPNVFNHYLELHIGIVAAVVLLAVVFGKLHEQSIRKIWLTPAPIYFSIAISLILLLRTEVQREMDDSILMTRNFYGVLRVQENDDRDLLEEAAARQIEADELFSQGMVEEASEIHETIDILTESARESDRELLNGRILHGTQFLVPERRKWPTTYYAETSGAGLAVLHLRPDEPRHIGVVGLGTGTMAAYGKPGDRMTYYEINSEVLRIAGVGAEIVNTTSEALPSDEPDQVYFSYIRDTPAKVQIVLGDARLSLERAEPQKFDILVLDAFSSDAIPAHLLTREAFEVYLRHMKNDGIIAVHISNRHFALEGVVAALNDEFHLVNRSVADTNEDHGASTSNWVLLSRTKKSFAAPELNGQETLDSQREEVLERVLWTDAYSNLAQVLRPRSKEDFKEDIDDVLEDVGLPRWLGTED